MRIISQDGSKNFPYEETALAIRIKYINDVEIYSIYGIYHGKEYEFAYYDKPEYAFEIMEEIAYTPSYIQSEEDEDDKEKILFVKFPTQEEMEE